VGDLLDDLSPLSSNVGLMVMYGKLSPWLSSAAVTKSLLVHVVQASTESIGSKDDGLGIKLFANAAFGIFGTFERHDRDKVFHS